MEQRRDYTLVTGASSGIGAAVASRIAPAGPVILHGRDWERLQAVRMALPNPEAHLVWRRDFAEDAGIAESLGGLISKSAAAVTGFIHCAGELRLIPSDAADPASVRGMFQVNYFSATAILRALLRKAVNRGSLRCVVFVSDIASQFGAGGYGVYAATKGALDSLCRSLAAELGPAVRVNSILPGGIRTRETEGEAKLTEGCLLGPGRADDIAEMCEYLMSGRARWITGQQFVVDGGKTAH